jgi:two-component system response regulator BaeR
MVVEDEPKIAALLVDYLHAAGYVTCSCGRGDQAVEMARAFKPDLLLLDINLPGCDGHEVCRQLRRESRVPILMLTARIEEVDRILGLELGADDYVCKPFSPREVVARVRALIRRSKDWSQPAPSGRLHFDEACHRVELDRKPLNLTPVEFRILRALAQRSGSVLSRHRLMDCAYDDHRVVSERTIDSHLKNLRRKLQEISGPGEVIEGVYGVGYRLLIE